MIGGVSFQPGAQEQDQQSQQGGAARPSGSSQGVQEAIKVLSLRLPKTVGAQAAAPSALLRSQGSNGNARVDSIVESVLSKFFPGASSGGSAPPAPMAPAPATGGSPSPARETPSQAESPNFWRNPFQTPTDQQPPNFWEDFRRNPPRIVVEQPQVAPLTGTAPRWPGQAGVDGSGGFPPSMIDTLPDTFRPPDLRPQLDWLPPSEASRPYEL